MFIQNKNLANTSLRLSNGTSPVGDPDGIFEVPDAIGTALTATKGWTATDQAPQKPEENDPVAALKELRKLAQQGQGLSPAQALPQPPAPGTVPAPAPQSASPVPPAPTTAAAPSAPVAEVPAPPPAPPEIETTGPVDEVEETAETEAPEEIDLGPMTKNELLATAAEYEIEVSAELKKGKVENLRAYLDKQLFSGD